jgi:hypothetical protein
LEAIIQKALIRRIQLKWVCFSWKQLEYMTPYFLVPGITCMVEWGWNHFSPQSLVDLGNISTMRKLWNTASSLYTKNIIDSNGNYDVIYGIISNFNWSVEGNKIICTTEISSRERLYAGVTKDYGLSVKSNDPNPSNVRSNGLTQSIRDFINKDAVILTLKSLVTRNILLSDKVSTKDLLISDVKLLKSSQELGIWYSILRPLLNPSVGVSDPVLSLRQRGMRLPYVFGIFAGRPTDSYEQHENFGTPLKGDFDKGLQDNDPKKMWINMGMVVSILNYFSKVPSGTTTGGKSNYAFQVDIQNAIISAHPNLISCDERVLIPNHSAPKFLYGYWGVQNNVLAKGIKQGQFDKTASPYSYQVLRPIPISNPYNATSSLTPNQQVSKIFSQQLNCYRDDLDSIINYNRYRFDSTIPKTVPQTYSFPAQYDYLLPPTPSGLSENKLVKGYSGLLSNVYISFDVLKSAIEDENVVSYPDIYKSIFKTLMDSVDGFWDLSLVPADGGGGIMTITDKKYINKFALDQQSDSVYSFDYMDADSIIKSLKFKPVMSDAQASRVMFGSINNKNSKYQYIDKNDLLDYVFRDSVIGTQEDKAQAELYQGGGNITQPQQQFIDLISKFQTINAGADDGTLQMSLNPDRHGFQTPPEYKNKPNIREYVKLTLGAPGGQQLLRLLLADDDYDNNPRYSAVQPGIFLELTLQGIGGLRTFQCFLIRNLPEPYSDRNVIFRITDVHQTLEAGNWDTTIYAQLSPLRGYIKNRLKGPYINNPNTINGWLPDPTT